LVWLAQSNLTDCAVCPGSLQWKASKSEQQGTKAWNKKNKMAQERLGRFPGLSPLAQLVSSASVQALRGVCQPGRGRTADRVQGPGAAPRSRLHRAGRLPRGPVLAGPAASLTLCHSSARSDIDVAVLTDCRWLQRVTTPSEFKQWVKKISESTWPHSPRRVLRLSGPRSLWTGGRADRVEI